jgi:hypothetical protein
MQMLLNRMLLKPLVADGNIHKETIDNKVVIYRYETDPIIVFSYGYLDNDNVIHWYDVRKFSTKLKWLAYLRAILRENLITREILSTKRRLNDIARKIELVKNIPRRKNV